uniref:Secreted protein n=1 Tax=Globodera pallida TaxID=36090 RepID=A0A183C089_GLOPA
MIILSNFFLLNVLVTLLGIANGAGTSPDKQKDASGKQPMEVDGAVQEKLNVNVSRVSSKLHKTVATRT